MAVFDRQSVVNNCLCRMCPSYDDCGEQLGFCLAPEKSACITVAAGCLCLGCPVWVRQTFRHVYFCVRGAESTQ
jgi:hypothetical protein